MSLPPDWCLRRPKRSLQSVYDFVAAPFRLVVFPDQLCECLHITSLRGERFATVLPRLKGRVLDVGAGDNALVKLYRTQTGSSSADESEGVDVVDWGGDVKIIESSASLPFDSGTFDTITFIACLNHIPERVQALIEAKRLLRSEGRLVITMINRMIGSVGHTLWWYSEDKKRNVDEHEEMGLDCSEVVSLLRQAGFKLMEHERFVYGMNHVFVAVPEK